MEVVRTFFASLWSDPALARSLASDDVTWITTRSMPIPGNAHTIFHVGWDAVKNVADSGKNLDVGYIPEYWDSKQAFDLIFGAEAEGSRPAR
jgi:hypothetical protein